MTLRSPARSRRPGTLAPVLLLCLGIASAYAQDDPDTFPALTLEAAVRIALDRNPAMRAAAEGIVAANETVGEARAAYLPEIGLEGGYRRWETHAFLPSGLTDSPFGGATARDTIGPTDDWRAGLRAQLTLFDAGARRAALRTARAQRDLAAEEAVAVRQDLALEVHRAFYALLSALQSKSVADVQLARMHEHVRLARDLHGAGAVPKADVLRAQAEEARTRLLRVRAEGEVRDATGALNTAMGLPVESPVRLDPRVADVTAPSQDHLRVALDEVVEARAEVRAAKRRRDARDRAVDAAWSEFGPKLRAEGGYGWRDETFVPPDEDWSAGVSVALPVFTGLSRVHAVRRAKAERAKADAEVERTILAVRREVWSAYSSVQEAFESISTARTERKDARESLRLTRERYAAGAATIQDLLDGEAALAAADAALVAATWRYHVSRSVFDRATGSPATRNR